MASKAGDPDYAPLLALGAAVVAAGTAWLIFRPKSADASTLTPGGSSKTQTPPPGGRPPSPAPAGLTPPAVPAVTLPPMDMSFVNPQSQHQPLFLAIYQEGASQWQNVGWFYGHAATIVTNGSTTPSKVFYTPSGEVHEYLGSLVDYGIRGFFAAYEADGTPDPEWYGRFGYDRDEGDPSQDDQRIQIFTPLSPTGLLYTELDMQPGQDFVYV